MPAFESSAAPCRVRVVGTAGSGKTTLAAEVARRLGVPHLELDALHNRPGWTPAPLEQFRSELHAFLTDPHASRGWVVDGNYQRRVADLLLEADTIVWLDYPRAVVMSRVLRRTVARGLLRRELWNGNRERLSGLVARDAERNIVLWAWRTHGPNRRQFSADLLAASAPRPETLDIVAADVVAAASAPSGAASPTWVRLTGPRAARRWLDGLAPP